MSRFTEKNFKLAFTITVTRCFGWSLPSTMVVPFADCANHFIIDNQYEMFNSRLHGVKDKSSVSESEQKYFTPTKMRIECYKHFKEDARPEEFEIKDVPYKTNRYIRKLRMREKCLNLTLEEFLKSEELKNQEIWDLKFISTSDEEDNDSSEEETSDSEEEKKDVQAIEKSKSIDDTEQAVDTEKQDSKDTGTTPPEKIWKEDNPGKNTKVPDIAKKLRPSKKKQRIQFTYSYDNTTGEGGNAEPKKNVIVKKRVVGRQPEDLIDLLVMQKHYMYEQEQRMKLLKDQDEEQWSKMTEEYNSSEEDDDEENFAWYEDSDKETYFVLCTKYKNVYEKGQQVFHCYGRRTNRFLLLNYGFCLNNNKYNSLSFRVWINFDWQKEQLKDQMRDQAKLEGREFKEDLKSDDDEDNKENQVSKVLRLKMNRINEEVFAYIRANLLNTYKGKNLEYLLVSTPVDVEFELLVVACTINLLKGLLASRFKTPLEVDQKLLEDPNLHYRKRFCILHRMNAKEVLNANIRLCEILMRILARFNDGRNFKQNYMRIVEDFETEDEIMINRLKVRMYMRELVANQKRVLSVAHDEEYIQKVKDYFEEKKAQDEQRAKDMEEKQKEDEDEYYDEEEEDYIKQDEKHEDETDDQIPTQYRVAPVEAEVIEADFSESYVNQKYQTNYNDPEEELAYLDMQSRDINYEVEFDFNGYQHQDLIDRNLNMQCFLQTYTSKECIVCHPILQQIYLNAISNTNEPLRPVNNLKGNQTQQIIQDNLQRKYMTSKDFYNVKIVNDIIYNESTHIVAVFKDYLIYDDLSEFLKRIYDTQESIARLPKICEFYEKNSKVFPNYVQLPESKFMFKNIERKQKIIDDKIRHHQDKDARKEDKLRKRIERNNALGCDEVDLNVDESSMSWLKNSMRFFDTQFVDSVLKQEVLYSHYTQHSSFIKRSHILDNSSLKMGNSILNKHNQAAMRNFSEFNLESLMKVFISKESNDTSKNVSKITASLDITMQSFHYIDESEKFIKAIAQQQQKQKEIILKQMKQRKESSTKIIAQSINQNKIQQPMIQLKQIDFDSNGLPGQEQNTQQPLMYIFKNSTGMNPYLKQQKYFEKIKTDQKKRSPCTSIAQASPPTAQNKNLKTISPPKSQEFQKIYGVQSNLGKVPIVLSKQISAPPLKTDHIAENIEFVTKKGIKKIVSNNNHQQIDFKIKHGSQGKLGNSGSQSQRESLQQKLISNIVNNKGQQMTNQFSPLDIKDQTLNKKVFIYNPSEEQKISQIGSQSARVISNEDSNNKLNKDFTSHKEGQKRKSINTQQSPFQQSTNIATNFGQSIFEYRSSVGSMPISSLKLGNQQDRDHSLEQLNLRQKGPKPKVIQRIDQLIKKEQQRGISPRYIVEESKHGDMSNTLNNQSNNHLYNYQQIPNQNTQPLKFMSKRTSSKIGEESYRNPIQISTSNGNSGYNSNVHIINHTSSSSSNTNQIMKVLPIDINDISTNLNNNSRNFLVRQQQQQIQLQKQSRGMNPRQKSVPKNKANVASGSSPQNINYIGQDIQQNHNPINFQQHNSLLQSQIQGRQTPSTARNYQPPFIDSTSLVTSQHHMIGSLVSSTNNRHETQQQTIKNNKYIIKKVLQNSQHAKGKSSSQNRAREPSPMDYQVQMLGSLQSTTIQQPERRSLERPSKYGLPYQQQAGVNSIIDNRVTKIKMSIPKAQKSPSVEVPMTIRNQVNSNSSKKIVFGEKGNIVRITKGGIPDLMDNFDSNSIFDKDTVDFNYKLILIGHQRVGKTSIINRFINDMFNEDEASSSTAHIQKKLMKIDKSDKWAQLHIWDTLGQEDKKSLSPLFFRKTVGCFLVFDCTSERSFREVQSWYQQVQNSVDTNVLFMMLGNKCDLPHREVSYNVAMEYARKQNFGFLEVSAKSGTNIKNAFNCLVREIYRMNTPQKERVVMDKTQIKKGQSIRLQSEVHMKKSRFEDSEDDKESGSAGKKGRKKRSQSSDGKCFKCG